MYAESVGVGGVRERQGHEPGGMDPGFGVVAAWGLGLFADVAGARALSYLTCVSTWTHASGISVDMIRSEYLSLVRES